MIRRSEEVALSTILQSDYVFFFKGRPAREEVVKSLASGLYPQVKKNIAAKALYEAVAEVEKLNNVLETGFFIPHAKLVEIDRFHAALAVIPEGFDDPKSGATVKAALLLLTPNKPLFFQQHLNMLSKLSRMFQPAFIESIAAMKDGRAVCEAVKKAE
ncbi:MAG: PTS sugar transporter subunit IIA [Elusimicrobia bacterium]|nr:PTS sugar transporter subunit IIA [Elusimicrobiota bacterium]